MDDEVNLGTINLPLFVLQVALTCASTEDARSYLQGIYVHAVGDEYRIAATDGKRLFVYSQPLEVERQPHPRKKVEPTPEWTKAGIILPSEGLKERLALFQKLGAKKSPWGSSEPMSTMVQVTYGIDQPHFWLHDRALLARFRMSPVDGKYPDYQRTIDHLLSKGFAGREIEDLHSVAFDRAYIKHIGDLGKMLNSKSVRVHAAGADEPTLITFPGCEGAIFVVLPMQAPKALGHGAARVLAGAVSGSVAALRAHQTRWAQRLDDPHVSDWNREEAEAKVKEYGDRIAALLDNTKLPTALPAPAEPAKPEAGAVNPDALWEPPVLEPEEPKQPEEEPSDSNAIIAMARNRAALKGKARDAARRKFAADVNAVLSKEGHPFTVGQLHKNTPLEQWFDAGMIPSVAATRCLEWRLAKDVLSPEELPEGQGDKPIALVQAAFRVEQAEPPPKATAKVAKATAKVAKATVAKVAKPKANGKATPPPPVKKVGRGIRKTVN